MSKRIHELAKEWGHNPKDLIAVAERLGIRGKRSQSSLTDEEVTRLRDGLGLAPRPAVTLGSERVVAERVVTQRDSSADQLVTAIEQTTETRLRPNVIRRRTAREVLKREELPPAMDAETAPADIPPSLDFEPEIPPSLPGLPAAADHEPTEAPPVDVAPVEPASASRPPASAAPVEPVAASAASAPAPPPAAEAPARPAAAQVAAPSAVPAGQPGTVPPPGFEQMRGVKVLGKIDLRKAAPPPSPGPGWRPAGDPGGGAPPAGIADGAPKKKKGRKVISTPDQSNLMERDFYRKGARPQKRKALPARSSGRPRSPCRVPRSASSASPR